MITILLYLLQVVYLPMFGFVESMNVGVAAALIVQRLFDLCPEARGDLNAPQKQLLRAKWREAILARHGNRCDQE